jgi:hypothetical protein
LPIKRGADLNSDALNTLLTPLTADETDNVASEPTRNDRQLTGAFSTSHVRALKLASTCSPERS